MPTVVPEICRKEKDLSTNTEIYIHTVKPQTILAYEDQDSLGLINSNQ